MRRARLHETERRGDAFIHHFAELAGGLDLALARRGDAFDRQQFAADLGPGEPGHGTDLRFFLAHAVLELAHPGKLAEVVRRNRDAFDLVFEDLAQALASQPGEFPLQRAHARLAGVIADQVAQTFFGQLEFAFLEAMFLDLLGKQVALGDLDLFVLGIAFEPDDLHPVEQGLRQVQAVRRRHEHDVRQVEVEFQIVVLELAVLFGVEHFEQRRSGIAAEVLAQLVDLVEQEQRVDLARLLEVGDDFARERADIGAPVPADFRFVAHAAERLAHEFASRRLGDALAQRGLADARRADEAQDRPLQLARARLHREIFDDPILDLLEAVVIGIEHLLRLADVFLDLALLAPGQVEQHVQIIADDRRFGAHRLHALELLELGFGLFAGFLAELGLGDLFGQFGDFVARVVVAAQLVLDRLELFVEIVFALGLFHLPLHAATDPALHLQHRQLAFHEGHDHFEPLERVALDQQRLLVRHLGVDRRGNRIRELAGIVDIAQLVRRVLAQLLVELGIFAELFDHLPHHRGHFIARSGYQIARRNHRFDEFAARFERFERCPLRPLNQHTDGAVGQLEQLQDLRHHADVEQIVALGIVAARVELREQENVLASFHRRFKRGDRFVTPHEQRHHHAGEHHDVTQGKKGVALGHQSIPLGAFVGRSRGIW